MFLFKMYFISRDFQDRCFITSTFFVNLVCIYYVHGIWFISRSTSDNAPTAKCKYDYLAYNECARLYQKYALTKITLAQCSKFKVS